MSAVVITIAPEIVVEQRVVLHSVSWGTYEQLMRDYENRSAPRFTYDDGELEIYLPTQPHEHAAEFLKLFVNTVTEERETNILGLGSTTFRSKAADKGVEPDGCFYVQNYERVFGIEKINLENDPPPDLIIEVDITSPSIDRFPIYAGFKAPEIWRYKNETVEILLLQNDQYVAAAESLALPRVTGEVLTEFLLFSQAEKRLAWLKRVREWARANPV